MKLKFVLAMAFVCFYITTQAQIGKGSIWVGGNIGYNKNKSTSDFQIEARGIFIRPGIGIAIRENTIAGIDISYSNLHGDQSFTNSTLHQRIKTYGAGVFIRRYVPVINRLYIFGQTRAEYDNVHLNTQSVTTTATETEQKGWDVKLDFSPGVSYAINKKLQLETGLNNLVSLQYSKMKNTSQESGNSEIQTKTTSFSAGINLDNLTQFHLGFRLLINNKG